MRCSLCSEDRKKYAHLQREKRVNTERIEEMRADKREMMAKKFGRQVSVAKLESLIIDPHVVELRQDQHELAVACARQLHDYDVSTTHLFSLWPIYTVHASRKSCPLYSRITLSQKRTDFDNFLLHRIQEKFDLGGCEVVLHI